MQIVFLVIIGAAAGFIATRMMKVEANIIVTIAIGILGALIGGLILRLLLAVMGAAAGFIGAIIGAMVLIWLYRTYIARR